MYRPPLWFRGGSMVPWVSMQYKLLCNYLLHKKYDGRYCFHRRLSLTQSTGCLPPGLPPRGVSASEQPPLARHSTPPPRTGQDTVNRRSVRILLKSMRDQCRGKKIIPHCAVKFEAGEENRIVHESLLLSRGYNFGGRHQLPPTLWTNKHM